MRLKLIIAVVVVVLLCRCGEDKVETGYIVNFDRLDISTNVAHAEDSLSLFLGTKGYIFNVGISGANRAENDKEAVAIYNQNLKRLREENLKTGISLPEGGYINASFNYILIRDKEVLRDSVVVLK